MPQNTILQELIATLERPSAVQRWQTIETHISVVLLTGEWVFKFKKPVSFGFIDYSSLQLRRHYCQMELEINRRFSTDIYDSLWQVIRLKDGTARLVPARDSLPESAEVVEYAVRMRQFSQESLLAKQLAAGLSAEKMDTLAETLANIHERLPKATMSKQQIAEATQRWALENFDYFDSHLKDREAIDAIREWTQERWNDLATIQLERCDAHRVRQCHGDLHLENVLYQDGQFQLFDGIEFNRELSEIDIGNDMAFLLMELSEHGYRIHARRLLSAWLEANDDYGTLQVLRFYMVYRAMVRAKVDLIRQIQSLKSESDKSDFSSDGKRYVEFAQRQIEGGEPTLFVMHGLSGSGKSTVAQGLVEHHGAVRVRSDWLRKRHIGIPDPRQPTPEHQIAHAYSSEVTQATYTMMETRCRLALENGYSAVADATFLKQSQRGAFQSLAGELGVPCRIVHCEAPQDILTQRLRERGADPSDATANTLRLQEDVAEPLTEQERAITLAAESISRGEL